MENKNKEICMTEKQFVDICGSTEKKYIPIVLPVIITNPKCPDTEIKTISDYYDNIDLVLIMSVFPGFGGQKFIPEVLDKIKLLKEIKDKNNYNFDIEVDGGVNFSNSKDILNAGANILVSGTTIFKENRGDIKKNIDTLRLV